MPFDILESPSGKPVTAKATVDGVLRVAVEGGSGGGGDASLAEQQTQTERLDSLLTSGAAQVSALSGLSTETTSGLIKTAIQSAQTSGDGKLDTLHSDLGALLTQATGASILSELQSQGIDIGTIQADTASIYTRLGLVATSANVLATNALVATGNGSLATVASLLASQATAANQVALKAVADAMAASLAQIHADGDGMEALAAAENASASTTAINTTAIAASVAALNTKATADPSTATLQGTANSALSTVATNTGTSAINSTAIAASVSSIDAGLPNALGQGLMAASTSVAIASNQSALPVTGTFYQATQPVSIAATVTVDTELSAAGPLAIAALQGGGLPSVLASDRLKVDGSGVTQPVSIAGTVNVADGTGPLTVDGTITSNIGTTNGLALDATLTGGTAKAIVRGGAKGSTTAADATSTASGANHQGLDIINYDSSGNPIFGTAAQMTTGGLARPTVGFVNAVAAGVYPNALGGADTVYPIPVTNTGLIVEGRTSSGSAYGAERPLGVAGKDASGNVQRLKTTTTGDMSVTSAAASWPTDSATLPAAATSHVISSTSCKLKRIEWDYPGTGTKYIVICDQAGGTATAANWTHWFRPMTNAADLSWFEFPEGLTCTLGCVVGVVATEPLAGVAITLSAAAAENFGLVSFSTLPLT